MCEELWKEDLDSQQKHHQSGENKIKATVIVAEKEMIFRGLEVFRFQRRHKSLKNVRCKERLGLIAAPQGNETTSNVTTENISVKLQRLTAVWKCWTNLDPFQRIFNQWAADYILFSLYVQEAMRLWGLLCFLLSDVAATTVAFDDRGWCANLTWSTFIILVLFFCSGQ